MAKGSRNTFLCLLNAYSELKNIKLTFILNIVLFKETSLCDKMKEKNSKFY